MFYQCVWVKNTEFSNEYFRVVMELLLIVMFRIVCTLASNLQKSANSSGDGEFPCFNPIYHGRRGGGGIHPPSHFFKNALNNAY